MTRPILMRKQRIEELRKQAAQADARLEAAQSECDQIRRALAEAVKDDERLTAIEQAREAVEREKILAARAAKEGANP